MTVEFRRDLNKSFFIDPKKGEKSVTSEVRYDPLTGHISRVFPFRRLNLHRHDWEPFVEKSRQQFCPFCPESLDKATPRFTSDFYPQGHVRVGNAVAVPNLHPYEKYASVVVMCKEHYVPMVDIYTSMIVESFKASLEYLQIAQKYDPEGASYSSLNWNYMPYAGGSLIHPHLQVLAGPKPGTYDQEIYSAANKYFDQNGNNYFNQLIEAEQKEGERYLGQTGNVHWMATYAPRHVADVTGILPGKSSIWDLDEDDLEQIAQGIVKITHYYDRINMPSFNGALYFGMREDKSFSLMIRMVGRFTIFPLVGSDITHMQVLHDDPWTVMLPENLAEDIKRDFAG
ncbi:MAG: hypothetical protein FH756_00955 [Firmicutes bacterium]|nr:hypothetical protein [Bacillota bacterium]